MNLTKYVACICEGAAEKAIMEILLDADKLIFKRDDIFMDCRKQNITFIGLQRCINNYIANSFLLVFN